MGLSRRQFTKEFQLAAVRRLEQGVSIAEAVRALEVNPNVLSDHFHREQCVGFAVEHAVALLDGRYPDGLRQVALARPLTGAFVSAHDDLQQFLGSGEGQLAHPPASRACAQVRSPELADQNGLATTGDRLEQASLEEPTFLMISLRATRTGRTKSVLGANDSRGNDGDIWVAERAKICRWA